jgi:CyaY protein
MTESEFNDLIEETLQAIEDTLDEAETDLDLELTGGVLTVRCENGASIIFTRQTPVEQLWIATPEGGFHFDYSADQKSWVHDGSDQLLTNFLTGTFLRQTGETFTFNV